MKREIGAIDPERDVIFRQWLDSCSPDDFLPPDCAVGAEQLSPNPVLPTLEADVGAIALIRRIRLRTN